MPDYVCVLDNQEMTAKLHQMQIYFIVKSAKGILYLHKLGTLHNYLPNK